MTASTVANNDSESTPGQIAPQSSKNSDISKKNQTLQSSVNYILKIPLGKIGKNNLSKARSFLSIVSKWHNEQGATLSEALMERLYEEKSFGGNHHVTIDSEMYNICMDAWNKSNANGEKIVGRVESIMNRMEERLPLGGGDHSIARPDTYTYNCLINAYSKWEEDSSEKIEGILEKMNAFAEDAPSSETNGNTIDGEIKSLIRPDEVTYNSLINYYATRKNDHLAAQRAEDLLLHISELSRQGKFQMGTTSFNIVLKAWGNSGGGIHGAQRAESVLQMMIKLYRQGHENVRPDAVSFSSVIRSYSKVDPKDASIAVEKVMRLLNELEGSFIVDSDTNISSCYNAAANVMIKSGLPDAVDRVKELVKRMKNMDADQDGRLKTSIIEAYASQGSRESFQEGKELLLKMMDDQDPDLEKDAVPFNILLNAILKGNSTEKIEQAEELMVAMDKVGGNARPDLLSFNMIISALSRSSAKDSEHEQKAVGHLRNMLKSYTNGHEKAKPDSFVFNCIISMLARSKQHEWADNAMYRTLMAMESQVTRGNKLVTPDTITYNIVIGKLAKSGTKQNAKKVMKLLMSMEKVALSNEAKAPDIITYTSVLRILEKVDPLQAADVASCYLQRAMSNGEKMQVDRLGLQTLLMALSRSPKFDHAMMASIVWVWMENSNKVEHGVLDSGLCDLVLIAFSKTNDAKTAGKALSFLSERVSRYKEGDKTIILPTVVGFSAALVSLAKANRIDDSLRLLEIMKVLSKNGVPNIKPDDGCYNSILINLARSQAKNTAAQALTVVRRMKEDLGQISNASLNSAINNCTKMTEESHVARRKGVEIAFQIFQLGRESQSFDTITFALMIRTCIKLTADESARFKLVEPLFKLCAKNGLVGSMVMSEIGPFKKLLIVNDRLPKGWTINVGYRDR